MEVRTVSAIVGIVNVATRTISTLASIRKRFKGVNLAVEPLSTQLVSVKAALDQIRHLVEESLQDDQPCQIAMNLNIAINGCSLLIRLLDDQISKLEHDEDNKITLESRVKTALKSKGIKECLARLHRQLSALNLIITAYNV